MSIGEGPRKGRGALSNREERFVTCVHETTDDGWGRAPDDPPLLTQVAPDQARTVISRNRSPDIPFEQSLNPYRGCEHGCVYCYARPTHTYLGLSPGLDFETRLFYKAEAPRLLEQELDARGYRCSPIALGANTDPYQPLERRLQITRGVLEVLDRLHHPVMVVTKSALVARDLDLLRSLAARGLIHVQVSVTTLDPDLARRLEPRAAAPHRRLALIETLTGAGIPVGVLVAPVIPALTDHELEGILEAVREAGAGSAGYVMLRLPHEVKGLFEEWLACHEPQRHAHVMSLVRQVRDGRENDPGFGSRMHGTGPLADLFAQRFALACRRLGLESAPPALDCTQFLPPGRDSRQLSLF